MSDQLEPLSGEVWEYRDNEYRVLPSENLFVKDSGDANWHPAVMYQRDDRSNVDRYVRRRDDFLAKFTRVATVD